MNRSLVSILILFLLFFAVGMILYSPGLSAPFFYDSNYIAEKAYAHSTYGISDVLALFQQRRPVPSLTFYLNHVLTGPAPYYFRIFNVVILAAGSVLATLFVLLLLRIPRPWNTGTDQEKKAISVLVGLLFLAHPLQVFVVAFVWQRMALLSCFFGLASLVLYIATRIGRFPYAIAGYGLSAFFFVCAVLSKESTVALIPTIMLAEGVFLSKSPKTFWKRTAFAVICLSVAVGITWIFLALRDQGSITSGMLGTILGYYRESGLTLKEVGLTQSRVLFSYLAMVFTPLPSHVQLVKAQTISGSLFDPPVTLFAVVGVAALVGAGLALLRKRPIIGFGICFLLIGLLPEAVVVPHFQFCSYRIIFPMVGLLLVIADTALLIVEKSANHVSRSNAFRAVAVLMLVAASLLGASTFTKNASWDDPVLMWKQALEASPRFGPNVEKRIYAEILNNLGEALVRAGKVSDAIQYFRRSVHIQPYVPQGLFNLANVLEQTGKIPKAMKYYKLVLSRDPGHAETHNNLGLLLREAGKFAEAKEHFRLAVKSKPHLARARRNYGIALMESGEVSEALKHFIKAVRIEPDSAEGHYDLGVAYTVIQDLPRATRHFRQAVRIDPNYAKAHHNLAIALLKSGRKSEAMYHLKRALEIDPDLAKKKRIVPPTRNNRKAVPPESGRP